MILLQRTLLFDGKWSEGKISSNGTYILKQNYALLAFFFILNTQNVKFLFQVVSPTFERGCSFYVGGSIVYVYEQYTTIHENNMLNVGIQMWFHLHSPTLFNDDDSSSRGFAPSTFLFKNAKHFFLRVLLRLETQVGSKKWYICRLSQMPFFSVSSLSPSC